MNTVRIALYAVVAVLVALLIGFVWGRSGKATAEASLHDARLRLDLAEARAALLGARVDLFEVNFGRATQHLQTAKSRLQDAAGRDAADERVARLKDVASRVARAQEQAGRLDQSANTTLAGALSELEQVAATTGGAQKIP